MKFDIAAKIVEQSQKAWVVHAGKAQRHYDIFRDNELVFLEVPYIQLNNSRLRTGAGIRRAIRQSIDLRRYNETTGISEPTRQFEDYASGSFSEKSLQALVGSINRIYSQAKVGDIVIVPGREAVDGITQPVVRFGEIAAPFSDEDIFESGEGSIAKVPFRRVRWLNTVPRKQLTVRLERRIGKPPAVRQITIDRDAEELLGLVYESYIFHGNSNSVIFADRYDGSDFVVLNRSSEIIAFLVSAHAKLSLGRDHNFRVSDLEEFTERHFSDASISNIEVDFASPGYWRIIGASVSLGAFVALGVAVLTSGMSVADMQGGIEVMNSVSPDGTAADLQESMNILLQSIDSIQLEKVAEQAARARDTIGLQSPTRVVP
ncbi:hypothetical protein [Ancylobacter radicis]|uniref:Uncharacterized protein n=1 Tax=Ancylobacter radicis TaxID=2836179 RepID=A0ABS5R392_9HYPH|nr:hypothetical protein [Ancylobacter radicis]MBS9476081.1 hypothetical protein [Ancylobacter radicis]